MELFLFSPCLYPITFWSFRRLTGRLWWKVNVEVILKKTRFTVRKISENQFEYQDKNFLSDKFLHSYRPSFLHPIKFRSVILCPDHGKITKCKKQVWQHSSHLQLLLIHLPFPWWTNSLLSYHYKQKPIQKTLGCPNNHCMSITKKNLVKLKLGNYCQLAWILTSLIFKHYLDF